MNSGDIDKAKKLSGAIDIAKLRQDQALRSGGLLGMVSNKLWNDRVIRDNKILGTNKELEVLKSFRNTDKYLNMGKEGQAAHDRLIGAKENEVNTMMKDAGFKNIKDVTKDIEGASVASTAFNAVMGSVAGTINTV